MPPTIFRARSRRFRALRPSSVCAPGLLVALMLPAAPASAQATLTATIKAVYASPDPVVPFMRRAAAGPALAPGAAVANAAQLDVAGTRAWGLANATVCRTADAAAEALQTAGFERTFAAPVNQGELQLLFGLAPATAAAVRAYAVTVRNARTATMPFDKTSMAFERATTQAACTATNAPRRMVVRTITAEVEVRFAIEASSGAVLVADISRYLQTDASETARRNGDDTIVVLKDRLIAISLQ